MDDPRPEILEMFLEAEENLIAQFDPCSDTFHRGDPTPVPVGGERVPDSMPTAYDTSGAVRDTPMDPTFYYLIEARSTLLEFKKFLGLICPAVEAITRAHKIRDPAKKNSTILERQGALIEILERINLISEQLTVFKDFIPNYDEMIKEVSSRSALDYTNKQNYSEFMQFITSCSQKVFKDSQNLMQKMKSLS
jgi:hypothetical protein